MVAVTNELSSAELKHFFVFHGDFLKIKEDEGVFEADEVFEKLPRLLFRHQFAEIEWRSEAVV